jgi:hypothetical protein
VHKITSRLMKRHPGLLGAAEGGPLELWYDRSLGSYCRRLWLEVRCRIGAKLITFSSDDWAEHAPEVDIKDGRD